MLKHYYDVLAKDMFEELYGGLYIGKNPTPERNSCLILYLNFSVVDAGLHNYREALDAHSNTKFNYFCDVYADFLPKGIKEELNRKDGAVKQLDYLCGECAKNNQKIFLFIDEYDHFTNKILPEPGCLEDYRGETRGAGYLRTFFDTIKKIKKFFYNLFGRYKKNVYLCNTRTPKPLYNAQIGGRFFYIYYYDRDIS